MEDAVYDLKSNVFENGDLIFFYTDGLVIVFTKIILKNLLKNLKTNFKFKNHHF